MTATTDAKDLVRDAVDRGVERAAASSNTAAQSSDVPAITQAVLHEVAPIIVNATNQEPWYQSRVTWGNYIALASPIIGPLIGHQFSVEEQAMISAICTAVGVAVGAGLSLYGRWFAKKPLGS